MRAASNQKKLLKKTIQPYYKWITYCWHRISDLCSFGYRSIYICTWFKLKDICHAALTILKEVLSAFSTALMIESQPQQCTWRFWYCVESVQIVFSGPYFPVFELSKSPYSLRIQENTDQKKLRIWTLFAQCGGNWRVTFHNKNSKKLLVKISAISGII